MKKCALSLGLCVIAALSIGVRPAAAQLGGLSGALKKAQTVVHMGIDLTNVVTYRSLRDALQHYVKSKKL